jgi:hypothetical protein
MNHASSSRFARAPLWIGLLVVALGPAIRAAADVWEPKKTWVFAVGLVHWKDKQSFDSFPKKGRLEPALLDAFKERGVPADQIVYLQDEKATQAHIERAFRELLGKTGRDDMLIVYFQGHGYWDAATGKHFFACYDCDDTHTWAVDAIFDSIERDFKGSRAMLFADCCGSGGLCSAAVKRNTHIAYACLASTFRNNSSTGAWTFTECLIKGLRGDPVVDLNGDGTIELNEFIRYAEVEVAFIEDQRSVAVTTGDFDTHLRLERATGPHDLAVGRHVEAKWDDGTWYKAEILAEKDGKIKVRYMDDDSMATLPANQVRAWKPSPLPVGTRVVARVDDDEDKKWHPGKVVRTFENLQEVHFDDAPKLADEWVPKDRVKAK